VHFVAELLSRFVPFGKLGNNLDLRFLLVRVEVQVAVAGRPLLGQNKQVRVGSQSEVPFDFGVVGAAKADEGGSGIVGDELADADVVVGEIGDFGIVVDAEEIGRGAEAFHHPEVFPHKQL
jgi:hypothetical protein